MQHEKLVEFVEEEAAQRRMSLAEFSEAMGMSPSQLYNIRSGKVPGLQICRSIARYTGRSLDYILYLAGQIEAEEISGLDNVEPLVNDLARRIGEAPPDQRAKIIKVLNALLEAEGL